MNPGDLSASEELAIYREMLQSLEDVLFVHDAEGRILYLSPAAEKWIGYPPGEPPALDFSHLLPPEFLAEALRRTERQTRHEEVDQPWDVQILTRQGERRWAQIRTRPVYDARGRLVRVWGMARDIQSRKEMEEELRRHAGRLEALVEERSRTLLASEEKYRSLFDQSRDGIVLHDLERKSFEANPKMREILGIPPGETMGHGRLEFFTGETNDFLRRCMEGLRTRDLVVEETQFRRKDGTEFPAEVSASMVSIGGRPHIQAIVRDIGERRRLEDQLYQSQRLEAVGTLAGGVAHDFNNLLMGIQGRVDLLRLEPGLAPAQENHLREIAEHVKSAAHLTRQLLGFAGRGKFQVEPADLNEIMDRTARLFGRTRKEIVIHRDLQEGLWTAEVDRGQIEQVLLNLLLNAWQAMPGGGDLFLATGNTTLGEEATVPFGAAPGRYVRISVADTGEGMDDATRRRLFEPFFTTKGIGKGTGLGLASSYGIVKNHKGFISARSEKGRGATFEVFLPASGRPLPKGAEPSVQASPGTGTILVVDDEETIVRVVASLLERMGYRVLTAASGAEALEAFRGRKDGIDLVLLDMVMPGMNGRETAKRIRAADPSARILVATGYGTDDPALDRADLPCDGVIAKPYDAGRLSEAIRKVLGRK